MMRRFVQYIGRPRWVVFPDSDEGPGEPELGLMIFGVVIGLYKGQVYYPDRLHGLRTPGKREFGESIHPPR